ncbi:hypothetical protein [Saccharomonospora marina]|nr:hypothetical protein [Saccharomonospora marina]
MLNIRMNELAVRALGQAGAQAAVPVSELAPKLRELAAEGVIRHGAALALARHAGKAPEPRSGGRDLTGWECATSSVHLEDMLEGIVPIRSGSAGDGEPVIAESDQVLLLRHGLGFALEIVRLVRALPEPVAIRCIVGANSTNATFRFHSAREGESWLNPDVDTYLLDKLIVVDSGPASLGGTPW